MTETAMLITAFSGLAVAVGALLVSVGVFFLVMKVGSVVESMSRSDNQG